MTDKITQTQLDNGLKILLKEIHTTPIISHWIWYRVGSRYEVPGKTGISHWVEHMQFKGTPKYPAGVLDRAISREGGMWNAFTHLDWTTFFETMPADKIDLALDAEADRMVNSTFNEEEVNSERTVVISEREGSENDPLFLLDEAVQSNSFNQHPYKNEVIGSKSDLHKIQREDLYSHYKTYYNPADAVLAVAGDFDTTEMLSRIQRIYDHIPGKPVKPLALEPEEMATSEKQVEVSGPGETTFLEVSYHAPAGSQHDFFAYTILDSLITGPTSLNMFGGGGISNKTSRLYRRLVEKEYAISVNASLQATYDPFLYNIVITVNPKRKPEDVLKQLDEEIDILFQDQVNQAEIDRAAKQARALFTYGSENITNQGFWLGYSEMFAQYSWFLNYVKELEKVDSDNVLQIARTYLQPSQRVVGIYRPDGGRQ